MNHEIYKSINLVLFLPTFWIAYAFIPVLLGFIVLAKAGGTLLLLARPHRPSPLALRSATTWILIFLSITITWLRATFKLDAVLFVSFSATCIGGYYYFGRNDDQLTLTIFASAFAALGVLSIEYLHNTTSWLGMATAIGLGFEVALWIQNRPHGRWEWATILTLITMASALTLTHGTLESWEAFEEARR
ncbi:MAG: hypothetical protein AAF715_16840 [Myxococcota bacterium]